MGLLNEAACFFVFFQENELFVFRSVLQIWSLCCSRSGKKHPANPCLIYLPRHRLRCAAGRC